MNRPLLLKLVGLLISFVLLGTVSAQEPTGEPGKPSDDERVLREQSIYIPYGKLREIFEKEGRGVFLPYEKFQELWKAAQDKQAKPGDSKPPVGVLITEIENEAVVERDVVTVVAKVKLDMISKGWHAVSLRLADAAIRSAKVGEQPARIVFDANVGHRVLVENPENSPKAIELTLEYSKAFSKSPGQNSVSFQTPTAPVNRWRVRIPQTGVKVNVQPLIAATEVPAGEEAKKDETVLLAFVGAAPEVRIDWTPKAEGAAGLEALTNVQTQQEVTIDEGAVHTRSRLSYSISRAELAQLKLEIPSDHKVTGVFDPNVRQWDVKTNDSTQTVTVQLFEPARTKQDLVVELEKLGDDLLKSEVKPPIVKAVGAGRQQGVVVVHLGNELRGEVAARRGVLQLDAAELPQPLASGHWDFSFRYAATNYELALRVEKVQPLVRADELVEIYVEPELITIDSLVVFDIERAGVFQVELDIPAGFDLRSVRGRESNGVPAAPIDAFHLEGEQKTHLRVNLSKKAIGKIGLFVELQRRLSDPNLLSPTGTKSEIVLTMPRVTSESVDRATGKLVLYAPESLLLNPTKNEGLTPISFQEALQPIPTGRDGRFGIAREVLSYAFSQPPTSVTLSVERRRHQITARQFLLARVEAGVVKYDDRFTFDILYSGVKSLRVDIPAALTSKINLITPGIRKAAIEPAPEGVADGYVAWSFAGETELLGTVQFQLTWEQEIEELDVGKSVTFDIPVLTPQNTDRAWGQVVVAKAETLDVTPSESRTGLRPIDPNVDLMPGMAAPDAALAFEHHEPWKLGITATRYQLEDVKRTSIERAVLRSVSTLSGRVSMQALYRLRSSRQRLAVPLPKGAELDNSPFRINGQPIQLERGSSDEFLVPLTGQNETQAFLLELRYTVPGNATYLDFPTFPGATDGEKEAAVQKVYMCVYLPQELAVLGSDGPWEDELSNVWFAKFGMAQAVQHGDAELINWVREGLNITNDPYASFPTQGTLYTFSTLNPKPLPDGALKVVAFHSRWLHMLVYGFLCAVGLLFMRAGAQLKFLIIGILLVALVAAGVFLPTFSLQVINPVLLFGLATLAVVWTIAGLVMSWPTIWSRMTMPASPGGSPPATAAATTQSTTNTTTNTATEPTQPPVTGTITPESSSKEGDAANE